MGLLICRFFSTILVAFSLSESYQAGVTALKATRSTQEPRERMSQENSTRVLGDKGWTMEPPLRCASNVQPWGSLDNPKRRVGAFETLLVAVRVG